MRGHWLLKIGVGGVQGFIAQARKTRDLAAGSRLVGRAMQAGIAHLDGLTPGERISPIDPANACPHQALYRLRGLSESGTHGTCHQGACRHPRHH